MEAGDGIDVLAPLGHGFPEPEQKRRPVLIAGGVGVGPILYLANSLAGHEPTPILILGARTATSLPQIDLEPGVKLLTATDDGTAGYHGTAVALAQTELARIAEDAELYLCGPHPMLAAGHSLAVQEDLPAWVAMEQMMGCAVGACMGCAIPVHGESQYARVCTEGPVFRSTEVDWERVE
jgi:dihydroorotate dehydrogenase electron transfer subunit